MKFFSTPLDRKITKAVEREDDRLAVVLDPFNSRRQGYRFEVNANGVRNDMLYQGNKSQSEWTVIWEAAGDVNEEGWTVEMEDVRSVGRPSQENGRPFFSRRIGLSALGTPVEEEGV